MGIENIDILKPDEFSPASQVRERNAVSRHIVEQDAKKFVFGWDPPLASFYLQVHDLAKDEDDEERIPVWLGADKDTVMTEVSDLVTVAEVNGLYIPEPVQGTLQTEKNWNR